MRFHLPALPGRPTKAANSSCAYSAKVAKFARMMEPRGHEVFIYGGGGHDGAGTYVPTYGKIRPLDFNPGQWVAANARAIAEISERAEPGDFLGIIAGLCQEQITDALPEMRAVEYGIGYGGVFADFRVFESYAWMHSVYAAGVGDPHTLDGRYFDAVIPNYFDVGEFPAGPGGDYLLYVGRLIERKGVELAGQVAERAGLPLIIAGEGPHPPSYGECIGSVGPKERAELMGGARALLAPTQYIEPFGGVAVEAMMCGTPAITTDWGAFPETVRHGVSGFRCRTMGQFLAAVEQAPSLGRAAIRDYAVSRYSLEAIAPRYEGYFEQLQALDGEGFYDESLIAGLPIAA